MEAQTPLTPLEPGGEMFTRARVRSVFLDTWQRPTSVHTEFEGESEDEDTSGSDSNDPINLFEMGSLEDNRRRSQSTMGSFDEAPTPKSTRMRPLPLRIRSIEGPKGPHLFRASHGSTDLDAQFALQMSPMLPQKMTLPHEQMPTLIVPEKDAVEIDVMEKVPTPVIMPDQPFEFSIDSYVARMSNYSTHSEARNWNSTQVIDWLIDSKVDDASIECFEKHDVTGDVLLDLTFDDLKELGIVSFGKRHQLWNGICELQGRDGRISPSQTPFQDLSRPATTRQRRSPDNCATPTEESSKKRRGRKATSPSEVKPDESVSIVAIEQLVPKPHKCNKGERCAKWRKQQREFKTLQDEHGWPVSPSKGGHIVVAGNPGNASTAANMFGTHLTPTAYIADEYLRPQSDAIPSVVASSDLLGPGHLPEFAPSLDADSLDQIDKRDPQDNVRAFLQFQHLNSPSLPLEDNIETLKTPMRTEGPGFPTAVNTLELFPVEHVPSFSNQAIVQTPTTPQPHQQLKSLPKLDIPESATPATELLRSATASPGGLQRFATPASDMDVPASARYSALLQRVGAQSVPADMQFRDQQNASRPQSRARHWGRPSMGLESVKEYEVLSPSTSQPRPSLSSQNSDNTGMSSRTATTRDSSNSRVTISDPAHSSPEVKYFGYGSEVTQAGWMKHRKTKMLRHEWQDRHFRLKGTQLGIHNDEKYQTAPKKTIDTEQYSVACNSGSSNSKLQAAFKSLAIKDKNIDSTAFAFQLVPETKDREKFLGAKTHHFAVTTKDERIDWMRELMLAKALQQKREGYEVEINGVQA